MKEQLKLLLITGVFLLFCCVSVGQVTTAYQTIKNFEIFPSLYVKAGSFDVRLTDGFNTDIKDTRPYRFEGQSPFDSTNTPNRQEWDADKTVNKLLAETQISNYMLAGIWNTNLLHPEYFLQKSLEPLNYPIKAEVLNYTPEANEEYLPYAFPISDKGFKLLDLKFKPFIDKSFSTLKVPANTFVVSSNMEGLITISQIIEYPETFIESACLSKHWPGTFKMAGNTDPVSCLKYLNDNLPLHQNHKIFFNYGAENLDPNYKPNQQQAALIMKLKDYSAVNWITKTFAGGAHNDRPWNKRFYISLKFLLGK